MTFANYRDDKTISEISAQPSRDVEKQYAIGRTGQIDYNDNIFTNGLPMDRRTDRQTHPLIEMRGRIQKANAGLTDRPTDRQTDRRTDEVTYRVASTRLKINRF